MAGREHPTEGGRQHGECPASDRALRRPTVGRRRLLVGSCAVAALGLTGAAVLRWPAHVELFSDTVGLRADGTRAFVPDGAAPLESRTRLLTPVVPDSPVTAAEQRLLAQADEAGERASLSPRRHALLVSAALDLHVLSWDLAAPVAGWSNNWRFVWPRDAAHAAVAELALGRVEQAASTVQELGRLCGADGWFEARYRPGTTRAPDDRERQLDGSGWYLWALHRVGEAVPSLFTDPSTVEPARRCARLLLRLTEGDPALPPPSPDYWEVREDRLTIATAALVLVGLERAGRLGRALGEQLAERCAQRAEEVRAAIGDAFGPTGFGRYAGGSAADSGLVFLLPPYTLRGNDAVAKRLRSAEEAMRRPAGGVAPGEGWKQDGISWTPETALFAQAYGVTGDGGEADRLLDWLAAHRTASGSFPEKVLVDGAPAAVAPLAWTASLVISTLLG